jgi:hypothetical protein
MLHMVHQFFRQRRTVVEAEVLLAVLLEDRQRGSVVEVLELDEDIRPARGHGVQKLVDEVEVLFPV